MAKPEWGSKRICQSCGAKFYDLGNTPIVCPACGATFDPEAVLKSRRGKTTAFAKEKARPVKSRADEERDEAIMDEDIPLEEDSDSEESLVEDTSDLGDDDLDVEVEEEDKES